jgi:hypothetical protein
LVRLTDAAALKELFTLMSGLFIGAPWLLWVMVFLTMLTFTVSMGLRKTVGPEKGQDYLSTCGPGDNINREYIDEAGYSRSDTCPIHYILGEEYFPTVATSMFTTFRCLIGECSTRLGQSLTVHMARGFGWKFYVWYCFSMTLAIFGVFNVITALFCEALITGLQTNDTHVRHKKMYETRYVRGKLTALCGRIDELKAKWNATARKVHLARVSSPMAFWKRESVDDSQLSNFTDMTLNEQDYTRVMQDQEVKQILQDLDVETMGNNSFDFFDVNADGCVSMPELLGLIMKLRGEPRKADVVANWEVLRRVQEDVSRFKLVMAESQREIIDNQHNLLDNLKKPVYASKLDCCERSLVRAATVQATPPRPPLFPEKMN